LYHFKVVADYCSNFEHCVFEPLFKGLEATYTVHLRLTGKLIVDFLFVLIELFCYQTSFKWSAILQGTCDVHLRLIGKLTVDFLLLIT